MAKYTAPWMTVAYEAIGTRETPGNRNTSKIMDWAKMLELTKDYTADSVPWCGLFVAYAMGQIGLEPVKNPLWALNWKGYGKGLDNPAFGCIMCFVRNGGGHVGFYVGEDSLNYMILGGNQSDEVSITRVAKKRCVAYRWPPGMDKFLVKGRIKKSADEIVVSQNEV